VICRPTKQLLLPLILDYFYNTGCIPKIHVDNKRFTKGHWQTSIKTFNTYASHGFFGSPDAKVLLACLRPPLSMENNLIVWSCEFLILDIESRVSIKFIFNVLIRLMFVSHIPLF